MDKDRIERRMERERDSEFEAMHARKHELERAHDAQVEAATYRAVGEAIHKGHKVVISLKPVTYEWHLYEDEIEALRQGKMPAGWEGR